MTYPYKPDETFTVKNWTIRLFKAEHKAMCHQNGSNLTIVISDTTDYINIVPDYVVKALRKKLFLREWETRKIKESTQNINLIINRYIENSKKLEKMGVRKE